MFQKSAERILGDESFVEQMLSKAQKQMEQKYTLMAQGYDLEKIAERVTALMELEASDIWAECEERKRAAARNMLC